MIIYALGPAGSFSHEAALKVFVGKPITLAPNFDALFAKLHKEPKAIAIVPVENSLHGSVDEVLDLLKETTVRLWRTHDLAITHALGAQEKKTIKKFSSHPQALRQCRKWLHEHFPDAEHFPVSSTSYAVDLAKKDASIAAIASIDAIKKAKLQIIARNIEGKGNTTRFGIVSVKDPYPELKRSQMTIVLHPDPTKDRPGLLHAMLTPFKVYDVNLTRIENRPTGLRLGDYLFYIDFKGTQSDPRTKHVMKELRGIAQVEILGEW